MKPLQRDAKRNKESDDEYNEAEDEDYNPAAAEADAESSSDDEAAPVTTKAKQSKQDVADDELDSGDEATIKERQSGKRKRAEEDHTDDSFIRTRAQRLAEKVEAKNRKRAAGGRVTVDVDSLWSELSSHPVGQPPVLPRIRRGDEEEDDETEAPATETITIKRRIKYAGAITEVEEEVARDSKEAQEWLAEQEKENKNNKAEQDPSKQVLRPLRRISRFEPNPLGIIKGIAPEKLKRKLPSKVDLIMAERRQEEERAKKAEKLSTMQKTQLDWKGFVIEQGITDELKAYGKSSKGFIEREAFLNKVHGANENARRTARLKG